MSKYTIRVELEGSPTREQYDTLHLEMKSLGFLQTVNGWNTDKQSVVVKLPTGLYYGDSVNTPSDVSSTVYKTASRIRKVVGVFVAKTETWSSQP